MTSASQTNLKLGINGLGRIGKLTVWHYLARKYFDEIVVWAVMSIYWATEPYNGR